MTGLTNGTPYFFAVSAVNAGGESALSVERSATASATPPPGAPTNIRPAAGDNQVTVSWDNVTGATSYNIYYGTSIGVTTAGVATGSTEIPDVTSPHTETGLLNGTTYVFVVTAANGNGESVVSFEDSAKPIATPPPAAPSLTSATAGNTQVTLAWGAVTGATSYNVYYGTATGITKASGIKIAGVTSPYDVTGRTNGTSYFFIVTAQSANGESAASNERSATPTAPAGAFSQADLTGTWRINMLETSSDNTQNGWLRATGAIDASGNMTVSSYEDSTGSGTAPPAGTLQLTIDGSGVVSESGVNGGDNVHMTMTSNKNFIAGTAGNGRHQFRIIQKVDPGTVYSNADLANKSFVMHGLTISSGYNAWIRMDGTTDANRMISFSNDIDPFGDGGPKPNVGTLSVDGTGTVTFDTLPGFKGFLSADKKTIVVTSTEIKGTSTYYDLWIIQITGQTYAASDLVGTWSGHQVGVGSDYFWTHGPITAAIGGGLTGSPWVDSSGGTNAISATASITSSGTVTLAENPSFHGTMSFDKMFIVDTRTSGPGIYSMNIWTR